MAKFCTRCGRRLEDGEVCNCSQQTTSNGGGQRMENPNGQERPNNSQQWEQRGRQMADQAKNMFQVIGKILKNPVTETRKVAKGDSPIIGLEFMITKAVIFLIMMLIGAAKLSNAAMGFIEIPYFKLILLTLLLTIAVDVAEAVLLKTFVGTFKGTTTTGAMFSVVGTRTVYDTIVGVLVVIGFMMSSKVGLILFSIGSLFLPYVEYAGYQLVAKGDENKKLYAFFVAKVCAAVLSYIILKVLAGDILSGLLSFSSLF